MSSILLNVVGYENAPWRAVLERELPHLTVLELDQVTNPEEIEYAAIWHHPYDDLNRYPNLKAVFNLGAGTDHIDRDPALAQLINIPVVRLLDPDVGIDMAHYVLYWAMHFQRGYEKYRMQAAEHHWHRFMPPRVCDWRVTILGLGRIGQYITIKVKEMGFKAQAWNRSAVELQGVNTFAGYQTLETALSQSDVVVNCLPMNAQTSELLDQQRFAQMPKGSFLISLSRGGVINHDHLLAAMQQDHIRGAALDCFAQEPLSADSPLWEQPNVFITPHISGATFARSAAQVVVENIRAMESGKAPTPIHYIQQV